MDNVIRLITTEGCEGCRIAENLTEKAISISDFEITFEVVDCLDPYYWDFIETNKITDYPTTVYMIDDKVKKITIGTMNVNKIVQHIQKVFGE